MFYKLGKKFFHLLIDFIRLVQVVLIFLSFFIILYWILQLAGATFIEPFAPFFEGIKSITHIFYNRTVKVDTITIDFSFLVATFAVLLFAWGLKFVVECIEFAEKKYDSIYKYFKKKSEDLFNKGLERQYLMQEHKNNKFLLLIKFSAVNLSKDKFFNKDAEIKVEEKEIEILEDFSNNLEDILTCEKSFLNEELLLNFDDFDDVDEVLLFIENIMKKLKRKYEAEQWKINFLASTEVYANAKEIMPRTEKLMKLIKLDLRDKIVCLATFKQRYSLIKSPKYVIEEQGVYKISGNEDVFCIKKSVESSQA